MKLVANAIIKHGEERLICFFGSLRRSFEKQTKKNTPV